jgi:hypothetical protein
MPARSRNKAVPAASSLSKPITEALKLLLQVDAKQAPDGQPPGESAVSSSHLRLAGLSDTDLRALVDYQLLVCSDGNADAGSKCKPACSKGGLAATEHVFYQLTAVGVVWAREILAGNNLADSLPLGNESAEDAKSDAADIPCWDAEKRTLWWAGKIVLRFDRRHAPLAEPILSAFQRQKWKRSLADPLHQGKACKGDPRLHDVIKHLNKLLRGTPLRFHGAGDGKGVRWDTDGEVP